MDDDVWDAEPFNILKSAVPPGCPLGHPTCGLDPGMAVLLLDASGQSDFFGISSVNGTAVTLEARGPGTGRRYSSGAQLIPVDIATYYIRPSSCAWWPRSWRGRRRTRRWW